MRTGQLAGVIIVAVVVTAVSVLSLTAQSPARTHGGQPELVAYWPLGTDARNRVADAHHGKVVGPALFEDQAVLLNGQDAYVDFGAASALSVTGSLSLALWLRPDADDQLLRVLGKFQVSENNREYCLFLNHSNRLWAFLSDNGTTDEGHAFLKTTVLPAVPKGEWRHLALTWDAACGSAGLKLYLDGEEAATVDAQAAAIQSLQTGTAGLTLGAYDVAPGEGAPLKNTFRGALSQLLLFRGVLTLAEIEAIRELGREGELLPLLGVYLAGQASSIAPIPAAKSPMPPCVPGAGVTSSAATRNQEEGVRVSRAAKKPKLPDTPVVRSMLVPADWAKNAPITFSGYSRTEPLTNFPVLVMLGTNISGFGYGDFQSGTNNDLRFTDASQTNDLNYEIEKWDTSGLSYVWVQVPVLTNNAIIWAFWGKSGETEPACRTNGATWDASFKAVWHLNETNALDSTSYHRNGTASSSGVSTVSGRIVSAAAFNGAVGSAISASRFDSNDVNTFTMSLWCKPLASHELDTESTSGTAGTTGQRYALYSSDAGGYDYNQGHVGAGISVGNNGVSVYEYSYSYLPPLLVWSNAVTDWTHLSVVYVNKQPRLYVNGALVRTGLTSTKTYIHPGYQMGAPLWGCLTGMVDEVRVSMGAQSSNWLWACYMNQASNSAFNSYGAYGCVPAIPTGLAAVAVSSTQINLTWSDSSTNETGFKIERKTGLEGTYSQIATVGVNTTSYQSTGLSPLTEYYYRIRSYNADGDSLYSGEASATTDAGSGDNGIFMEWLKKAQITYSGYDRGEPLTNFPALVVLGTNVSGFSYADFLSGTNADLRFTDATQLTELDYEIDKWNTNGNSTVWVRIPRLTSNAVIWAFWSKSGVTAPACTTNGATWDASFRAVWHMNETNALDSTANHRHGTATGGVSSVTGKIAVGDAFNGVTGSAISAWRFASNDVNTFTMSLWCKPLTSHQIDAESTSGTLGVSGQRYALYPSDAGGYDYTQGHVGSGISVGTNGVSVYEYCYSYLPGLLVWSNAVTDWTHVGVVYVNKQPRLYVNGRLVRTGLTSTKTYIHPGYQMGGPLWGCVSGSVDEVRVSMGAQSSNWLWACYLNQASNTTFGTYGPVMQNIQKLKITFAGYNRPETLTNFPALVRLNEGLPGFHYNTFLAADGGDLRFFAADETTPLDYEIDKWTTNGESLVWVRVPLIATNSLYIWAEWGDPAQTNRLPCTTNGSVWSTEFRGVWHMNEFNALDSTTNARNGTATDGVDGGTGPIGGANTFNGIVGTSLTVPKFASNDVNSFTMSFWCKPNTTHQIDAETTSGTLGTSGQRYAVYPSDAGGYDYAQGHVGAGVSVGINGVSVYEYCYSYLPALLVWPGTLNDWTHVTVTYVNKQPRLYINGTLARTGLTSTKTYVHPGFQFGGPLWGCLDGGMDEVRVEKVARSANWTWACYMNQASNVFFNGYSPAAGSTDLRGAGLSCPQSLTWGQTFTVNNTIENVEVAMSGSFTVRFYLSADPTITTNDTYLGSRTLSRCVWGSPDTAATVLTLPATPPAGFTNTDDVTIGMIIDADNQVVETDEANNANRSEGLDRDTTVHIAPLADFRKLSLTFASYISPETLTNFPALVRFNESIPNFVYGTFLTPNGLDLRFYAADETTLLDYEIEQWNTNGDSLVWVRVPGISSNGPCIWAKWGDAAQTNRLPCTTNGSVWASPFKAVWHMSETNALDSTINRRNGTAAGTVKTVTGTTGLADQFGGVVGSAISAWRFDSNDVNTFTMSLWCKPLANHEQDPEMTNSTLGVVGQRYALFPSDAGGYSYTNGHVGAGISVGMNGVGVYEYCYNYMPSILVWAGTLADWSQITVVYSNKQPRLYVNGSLVRTGLTSTRPYIHPSYQMGGPLYGCLDGLVDEVRIANIAQTPGWIRASYVNTASNAVFNGFSAANGTPNLRGSILDSQEPLMWNQSFTVNSSVENVGASISGAFTIKFYLSADATITTNDVYLGSRTVSRLAWGSPDVAATVLTLPATPPGGFTDPDDVYIGMIVDADNQVAEYDETDNANHGDGLDCDAVHVMPLADLRGSLLDAPEKLLWAQTVLVTNTVENVGVATTGVFAVNFYLSLDTTITTGDVYLGSRAITNLAPGASNTAATALTLPIAPPLDFGVTNNVTIGMVVDPGNQVGEIDESNNANRGDGYDADTAQMYLLDILPVQFVFPTNVMWNQVVPFTFKVKNQGTGNAGAYTIKFFASTDTTINGADCYLGGYSINGHNSMQTLQNNRLTLGQSFVPYLTLPANPPAGYTLTNSYYVGVVVDYDGQIVESDEGNNTMLCSSTPVSFQGKCNVDLRAIAFDAQEPLQWGQSFTVSNTIQNVLGTDITTNFEVGFYLSLNQYISGTNTAWDYTSDTLLGTRTVTNLAGGASSVAVTALTLPSTPPSGFAQNGTYYIGMGVDHNHVVREAEVVQNRPDVLGVSLDQVTITYLADPELRPTLLAGPDSVSWGQTVTVTNTVQNNGARNVTNSFEVKYYLSSDLVIETNDTYLGSRTIAGLAGGSSDTAATPLTLPPAPPAGMKASGPGYIGMMVDADKTVAESYEFNNDNRGLGLDIEQLTVTPATAQPDLRGQSFDSPEPLSWGQAFSVADVVENVGNADAGSFTVKYYLSLDSTIATNDVFLGSRTVTNLAAGATNAAVTSLTLPTNAPPGFTIPTFIGMVIDAGDQVAEFIETNNASRGDRLDYDDLSSFVITPTNTVIVRPDATDSSNASTLQTWLRWAFNTNAGFTVYTESTLGAIGSRTVLSVGDTAWVTPADLSGVYMNASRMKRATNNVFCICGPTDTGTAWGLYEFLDKFMGVRFYLPGDLYAAKPCWTSLELGNTNFVDTPYVKSCFMSGMAQSGAVAGESEWVARNRVQHRLGPSHQHTMYDRFPPSTYQFVYPEIYPLRNGTRYYPVAGDQQWQPCFTEPHLVDAALDSATRYFYANPTHEYISYSVMDGVTFCSCPRCLGVLYGTYNGDSTAAYSAMYWSFITNLAPRFAAQFPDKRILGLAYSSARQVPTYTMPTNVIVFDQDEVTDVGTGTITGPNGQLQKTLNVASFTGNHEWYFGSGYTESRIYSDYQKEYFQQVYDSGVKGYYGHCEAYPNWGMDGPKLWVFSRLWWDPTLDVDTLEKQFCDDLFGPASGPMRLHFRKLDDLWKANPSGNYVTTIPSRDTVADCRALVNLAQATPGLTAAQTNRLALFAKCWKLEDYYYQFEAASSIDIADAAAARWLIASSIVNDKYPFYPDQWQGSLEAAGIDGPVSAKCVAPDMKCALLDAPATMTWGQTFPLTNKITNIGRAASGSFTNQFYLITAGYGKVQYLGEAAMSNVAVGATNTAITTLTLPASAPSGFPATGTLYIAMVIDYYNAVWELVEVNNNNPTDAFQMQ